MMEDLIINMAISVVIAVVKNPAKKEHLKAALLKVRNSINTVYPGE